MFFVFCYHCEQVESINSTGSTHSEMTKVWCHGGVFFFVPLNTSSPYIYEKFCWTHVTMCVKGLPGKYCTCKFDKDGRTYVNN